MSAAFLTLTMKKSVLNEWSDKELMASKFFSQISESHLSFCRLPIFLFFSAIFDSPLLSQSYSFKIGSKRTRTWWICIALKASLLRATVVALISFLRRKYLSKFIFKDWNIIELNINGLKQILTFHEKKMFFINFGLADTFGYNIGSQNVK